MNQYKTTGMSDKLPIPSKGGIGLNYHISNTSGGTPCPYCSGNHTSLCPKIKSIKYFSNGTIEYIEFR
jgi:hypothetical protein